MNTFWVKIAGLAIVVVGLIVLVNIFSSSEPEPEVKQKTFYDVIEEDDKRLRAEPEAKLLPKLEPVPATEREIKPVERQFKEMTVEEQVEAERLFEMALAQRKMGRLPGMTYKLMVDYCREIIEKYPESVYAFKARRMLGDIPKRYWKRYGITAEEVNPAN